jgi:hypothetical protein
MAISSQKPELFRAILAMDAYHRGYGAGIPNLPGTQVGLATVGQNSAILDRPGEPNRAQAANFFAQEYTINGAKIVSYRESDYSSLQPFIGGLGDVLGWSIWALDLYQIKQAMRAVGMTSSLRGEFFKRAEICSQLDCSTQL